MGGLRHEWISNKLQKQDDANYCFVSDRSRAVLGSAMCARHDVYHEDPKLHGLESETANDTAC